MNDQSRPLLHAMKHPPRRSTTLGRGTISDAALTPWLEGSGLACRRGHEWLFENLSFEVRPAQLMWLRGRNGCGKTTLLRMIAGLTRPDRGRLTLGGKAVTDRGESRCERVYIGHTNALKDDLTASESLQFLARLHGRDFTPEAVMAALTRLGMHHRRHAPVRTLSQGQRRRVALARLALERMPALWILDEPFDALDTAGIESVNALLREHLGRGGSAVVTSHLPLAPDAPAARVLELDRGLAA